MSEKMNESLSALVDGEADELEIRRLLNQLERDDELRATWQRYQMMGAVMRGEAVSRVDLSAGIRQAIAGEPMDEVPGVAAATVAAPAAASRWRWVASGAVAASVMLGVVLVGLQGQPAQQNALSAPLAQQEPVAADVLQVAQAPSALSAEEQAQLEDAQRRLQEYVMQHTEQATGGPARGMAPFARVVNFGQEAEAQR